MGKAKPIYVWTSDHSGLPIASHIIDQGDKAALVLIPPDCKNGKVEPPKTPEERKCHAEKIKYLNKNGGGIVPKIWADEAMRTIRPGDYAFFDQIYGWQYGDALWKRGVKVWGGSKIGFTLETERRKTLEMFRSLGYPIPEQKYFGPGASKQGAEFLKSIKDKSLYVFKSDNPKVVTTVARDSNDELLQKLSCEARNIDSDGFLLQEKKEGIEFAVQGLYCNGKCILANVDIEAKLKYNSMSEVQTGCSFGLTFPIPVDHHLRKRVLGPLDAFTAKYIGTGFMDLSVIYDPHEDKIYPLEPCGCFDPETEALTDQGWKKYTEISLDDRVLSINPKTREVAWKPIKNVQVYPYDGNMVIIGNNGFKLHSSFDAMVTPNHNWIIQNNDKKSKIVETKNLKNGHQILRVGEWKGESTEFIEIPEYVVNNLLKKGNHLKGGRYGVFPFERKEDREIDTNKKYPALKIDTIAFMSFIGIFLAEGSADGYYNGEVPRRITISQMTKCDEVEDILKKLPFIYTKNKSGFRISSIQLGKYLYDLGLVGKKANDKFIPYNFKQLSIEYLKSILDGFALGDGHTRKSGEVSVFTCSKKLSDDLQEIIHKIGWVANIHTAHNKGTEMEIGGKKYTRNHDQYTLGIRTKKTNFQIYRTDNQNLNYREREYQGNVWCLEVADWHTFFVRRNGKAYFSGNSRPAYNDFCTLMAQSNWPLGKIIVELLDGKITTDIGEKVFGSPGFGASLRVFNDEKSPDQPVTFPEELKENYWLWDVYQKGKDLLTTGGEYGDSLGIITATGENPESALAKLREYYFKLSMPTKWCRDRFDEDDDKNLPLSRFHEMKRLNLI